jgi:hypothetical protein
MTTLFDESTPGDNQTPPVTPPVVPNTDHTDLLAAIKNERGEQKFKSVEDLINGYSASQEFITTLKTEKEVEVQAKADLAAKVKSQEELEQLLQTRTEQPPTPPATPEGLKQEDVLQILEQREVQKIADANVIAVKKAVEAAKGDMKALTEQAGLTPELAQQMAQKSPDALLKLLDVEAPKGPAPSMASSVNPSSFQHDRPPEVKRVMRSSKSSDLVDAWKAAGARSEAKLKEQGVI